MISTLLRFSPAFDNALFATPAHLSPSDVDISGDLYRVAIPHGGATFMSEAGGPGDALPIEATAVGASADLQRVVFRADGAFLDPVSRQALYTHDADGTRLTSVLPDGSPASLPLPVADQSRRYVGDAVVGGVRAPYGGVHSLSDDASRVFFYDTNSSALSGALYLRDGDSRTVLVSASHRSGDNGVAHPAAFIAASHDGTVAYFDSADQLTDDAAPGGGIYRYDLGGDKLTLLTPDPGDPNGLQLQNNAAIVSDDMSHIYFITSAKLTPDANAGVPQLYRWSADGVKLVTTTSYGTVPARVSRDGRYVVIVSQSALTETPTNGYRQLYVYDDQSGHLACASCRADGSASQGAANLDAQPLFVSDALSSPRNITDDGKLFFASADRLVPDDTGAGADIYLYDHGALSLITPGSSDVDAYMGDNTPDGHDVFFMTRQRLVRSDLDAGEIDLYDARVGGGFPAPPPANPPCREDDCQSPASARPSLPPAASTTARGRGNAEPAPPRGRSVVRSVRLMTLTAAQRMRLARTGRVVLAVHVTGGGVLSVRARGALSQGQVTLGSARRAIRATGTVVAHVTLRLRPSARAALARGMRLRMTLEGRLSGAARPSITTLTLARR